MKYKDWNIEAMTGYKPITTFYMDFSIADAFGIKAIEDTHKNAMAYAKTDYKVLTELVMALNWKIWEHNEVNETYAELYNKLYNSTANYATSTLKGEELSYYYRTTD
jgi:hypothetical protein